MNATLTTCLAVLLLICAVKAWLSRSFRPLFVEVVSLFAIAIFLNRLFGFPYVVIVAKSEENDFAVTAALFICMVLGMLAQFFYHHFSTPGSERTPFDLGLFVAPFFAAPIVFLPLLAAFQQVNIDISRLTTPKLMVFLVAFQNGFFWKDFFDGQKRHVKSRVGHRQV